MPHFSDQSRQRLNSCHEDLITLFNEVVQTFDCTILCGHRGEKEQNEHYEAGRSKVKYPHSKHNLNPSMAVDVAPYPIDWADTNTFYLFGGYVLGIAQQLHQVGAMQHRLRWGGDWDSDNDTSDQRFNDLLHFELIQRRP